VSRALAVVAALLAGAVAAQGYAPRGSGGCGINQSCAAVSYEAEASSGSGFACTAALDACFDPGPGTCNEYGTNGSGDIILGGTDCNPTIRWGDSSVISGSSWSNTNGAINCEGNCIHRNNSGPLRMEDHVRYTAVALGTCSSTMEGSLASDAAAGASTGARTRVCLCTSDGAGTPAYEWRNIGCPNTSGTTTTCPVCP
jgi:hypothetical protein